MFSKFLAFTRARCVARLVMGGRLIHQNGETVNISNSKRAYTVTTVDV